MVDILFFLVGTEAGDEVMEVGLVMAEMEVSDGYRVEIPEKAEEVDRWVVEMGQTDHLVLFVYATQSFLRLNQNLNYLET